MAMNLTQKILSAHLLSGELIPGSEISIRIDQTLTQDSTGTMAYLQFEAMGVKRVKTKKSVAYIDHNTLQTGFENADDHYYIQTVTKKHGIYCSKPGNGICHQVQLERFGVPGYTLLGWTLRSRWAAARIIWRARVSSACTCMASCPTALRRRTLFWKSCAG